jgi:hypothetical protein
MGLLELLALSAAGNIVLALAWLRARYKLARAIHSIVEVGEDRAEITKVVGGVAVTHKIIKENNVTL